MSSSMLGFLLSRGSGFRLCWRYCQNLRPFLVRGRFGLDVSGFAGRLPSARGRKVGTSTRLYPGYFLDRSRDAADRAAEIGQVDEGKQQARDPEDVHVREEREQAQDGYDLELHLVGFVCDPLRQS